METTTTCRRSPSMVLQVHSHQWVVHRLRLRTTRGRLPWIPPGSSFLWHAQITIRYRHSINATTGELTSAGDTYLEMNPRSVAVDPLSKFLFVANSNSDDVAIFTINPTTGALTPVADSPFLAGDRPPLLSSTRPASSATSLMGTTIMCRHSQSTEPLVHSLQCLVRPSLLATIRLP